MSLVVPCHADQTTSASQRRETIDEAAKSEFHLLKREHTRGNTHGRR